MRDAQPDHAAAGWREVEAHALDQEAGRGPVQGQQIAAQNGGQLAKVREANQGGQPVCVPARYSFVCKKEKTGWYILEHHSSEFPR